MKKIPVGDTIAEAYNFAFGSLGVIIGLIWLPTVLMAVGGFFANLLYSSAVDSAVAEGRLAAQGQAAIAMFGWSLLAMLLYSIASVAVTRQALGLRKGPAFVHFSLGMTELRVFAATVGLLLVLVIFYFAYLALVASLAVFGIKPGAGALMALAFVVVIAGACFLLYVAIRLSFLLVPSIVAGAEGGLTRSWILTQGNFWRIFLIGLAVLVPVLLVNSIAEYMIMGPEIWDNVLKSLTVTGAAQTALANANAHLMAEKMPYLTGLSLVMAPFTAGLSLGAAAFAYRALTTPPKPEAN